MPNHILASHGSLSLNMPSTTQSSFWATFYSDPPHLPHPHCSSAFYSDGRSLPAFQPPLRCCSVSWSGWQPLLSDPQPLREPVRDEQQTGLSKKMRQKASAPRPGAAAAASQGCSRRCRQGGRPPPLPPSPCHSPRGHHRSPARRDTGRVRKGQAEPVPPPARPASPTSPGPRRGRTLGSRRRGPPHAALPAAERPQLANLSPHRSCNIVAERRPRRTREAAAATPSAPASHRRRHLHRRCGATPPRARGAGQPRAGLRRPRRDTAGEGRGAVRGAGRG